MDLKLVEGLRTEFESDKSNLALMNIASKGIITELIVNRKETIAIDHSMSKMMSTKTKPTNQRSSGRCWIFAGLNLCRTKAIKKYKLPSSFEYSQSYLFFWDKLERSHYFLKTIVDLKDLPNDDRTMECLYKDLLGDGGQWDMFVNLIEKYGIVPQTCFTESHSTSFSKNMNHYLKSKLKEYALMLRGELVNDEFTEKYSELSNEDKINEMMKVIFKMLCLMIGTPLMPNEKVIWGYHEKETVHHTQEKTPLEFYEDLKINFKDYQCVVHDIRNEYCKLYTVDHLGNIYDMNKLSYLNLPIDKLKQLTKKSLDEDDPVWFCCNVSADRFAEKEWLSTKIYNPELLYGVDFPLNKKARMTTWDSVLTHAMVITGYNENTTNNKITTWENDKFVEIETKVSKINRWRIENSWGDKGYLSGFMTMTDEWFDEYVFEIAVPKKYLDDIEIKYDKENIITLPIWDQMGSAAQ